MAIARKSKKSVLPPRRGAPHKNEPRARERILETAAELFYREGVRAIGIDTVVAESGVSKASLYRTFDSKDGLITAYISERDRLFWVWWNRMEAKQVDNPRALLEAILEGVARQISHPGYRGCPFLNLATEFPDDAHPGRVVARANKEEMRRRLTRLCARIGMSNPEQVGTQLLILINGAYATGQMGSVNHLALELAEAATLLISQGRSLKQTLIMEEEMLSEKKVLEFAHQWVAGWNSHNLDEIMSHYAVDVVLVSPAAAKILSDPTGAVKGKEAVREYFKRGLEAYPHLEFSLIDVLWGISSVVLYYVNQKGTKTAEFMEVDANAKVVRVIANYNG